MWVKKPPHNPQKSHNKAAFFECMLEPEIRISIIRLFETGTSRTLSSLPKPENGTTRTYLSTEIELRTCYVLVCVQTGLHPKTRKLIVLDSEQVNTRKYQKIWAKMDKQRKPKIENRNSKTEPVILGTSSTLLPHIPEKNPVIFSTIMPPIFGEIYEGIHQDAHFKNKRLHPRASMGVSIPYQEFAYDFNYVSLINGHFKL